METSEYWAFRGSAINVCPGFWLTEAFSTSLKLLNGISRNLTGSKKPTSSVKFVFYRPIRKQRWPPWPLIRQNISDFSPTAEQNSMDFDRKQDLNTLCQVCVFRVDWNIKMAVLASNWLIRFRILLWNRWTGFKDTWQKARSKRHIAGLCFSGNWKTKMAALTSGWLGQFLSTWRLNSIFFHHIIRSAWNTLTWTS